MQKNKNRHGFALGAIVALVASTFVGMAPAQASESSAVLSPTGAAAASQNTMVHTETFETRLRYGTNVSGAFNDAVQSFSGTVANASIHYSIATTSAAVQMDLLTDGNGDFALGAADLPGATSVSSTTALVGYVAVPSTSAYVSFQLDGLTSISPKVDVTVTPFLDIDGTPGLTAGDSAGTPYVISFVPWSALGGSVTLGAQIEGNVGVTASSVVTAGNVRWSQLDGSFWVGVSVSNEVMTGDSGTISSVIGTPSTNQGYSGAEIETGNFSFSAAVPTGALSASPVASVSASLYYAPADSNHNANIDASVTARILDSALAGVTARSITGVSMSAATGVNSLATGVVRGNSAFNVNAYPYLGSATSVSVAVATNVTVSAVGAGIDFDADSGVILNGVTYTSKSAFVAAGFVLASGTTTFAVSTFGQDLAGTDTINLTLKGQNFSVVEVLTLTAATITGVYTPTAAAGLAGAAKSFALTVKDQWSVATPRTDLRIAASVKLGSTTSTTVSEAVVAGAATVTLAPTPATGTGSGVVTFTLQNFDQATQNWKDIGIDTATWNVYSYVAGTDAFTSRTVSVSASVSYGVNLSWSATVAIGVLNSYSDVVVSAPGLMIQNADSTTATASDTLTIAANGQTANLKFTSRLVGTYTVTFTAGTATTTSQVVFDAAAGTAGATMTFDTTSIAAGTTTTITGTLSDVNGNPVMTSGSSDVSVAWTGKGLPFGNSTTMETDAAGQLSFYVLVLSGEVGDAAISATYRPAGAAVSTKNVTVVQAVAVGKAVESATIVNVGTFNGKLVVYALNASGMEVSYKIAGKWVTQIPTADALQRYDRVVGATGVTIKVDIYVDQVLKVSKSVVTK
jgi:hypothetical protein